ncbi:MAG: S8 family serine peptidase [Acidobacteria bacterium]|nr:S8 family serine peptidase [Acidobacteriota bacterium]
MRTSTRGSRGSVAYVGTIGVIVALLVATAGIPAVATAPPQAPSAQDDELDISAITGGPGKPSNRLLDSRLSQLEEIERRDGPVAARRFAEDNAIGLDQQGRAKILIHESADRDSDREPTASGDDPEQRIGRATPGEEALFELLEVSIREQVERLGGTVRGRVANLVDASLPIRNLRSLDPSAGIRWVEAAPVPKPTVISEGVGVIRADRLQSSPVSYQSEGPISVGVIDVGFLGYDTLMGTELPGSVTVNSFSPGGIEGNGLALLDQVHGTACAEIVFDVAPDAQMFLANFDSISGNSAAFDWMISQGVDVISYSIGWDNAGPGDGRGPINDAVDRAIAAGIQVVTAAGNDARRHWQGQFTDDDGDGIHNFTPSDQSNTVFLNAGESLVVFLNWDDWFQSVQDYDLFILDSAGNIVARGVNFQTGFQSPTETAGFTAPTSGTYHVLINRFSATRSVFLEMFFFVDREMQYNVPAGSLTIPADSEGVVAVGATFWANDVIESFSSLGPTSDGRTKPDITAPDGVSTVSYGNLGFSFFGTSASAPHTAGAIALMKSRFGVFTLDEIRDILYGRAIDRGIAGHDNTYGRGRLDVIGQ